MHNCAGGLQAAAHFPSCLFKCVHLTPQVSAALASASLLTKPSFPEKADLYLRTARALYSWAAYRPGAPIAQAGRRGCQGGLQAWVLAQQALLFCAPLVTSLSSCPALPVIYKWPRRPVCQELRGIPRVAVRHLLLQRQAHAGGGLAVPSYRCGEQVDSEAPGLAAVEALLRL